MNISVAICEGPVNTKVIILTMNSSKEHVFRAFKAGASAYVMKGVPAAIVS